MSGSETDAERRSRAVTDILSMHQFMPSFHVDSPVRRQALNIVRQVLTHDTEISTQALVDAIQGMRTQTSSESTTDARSRFTRVVIAVRDIGSMIRGHLFSFLPAPEPMDEEGAAEGKEEDEQEEGNENASLSGVEEQRLIHRVMEGYASRCDGLHGVDVSHLPPTHVDQIENRACTLAVNQYVHLLTGIGFDALKDDEEAFISDTVDALTCVHEQLSSGVEVTERTFTVHGQDAFSKAIAQACQFIGMVRYARRINMGVPVEVASRVILVHSDSEGVTFSRATEAAFARIASQRALVIRQSRRMNKFQLLINEAERDLANATTHVREYIKGIPVSERASQLRSIENIHPEWVTMASISLIDTDTASFVYFTTGWLQRAMPSREERAALILAYQDHSRIGMICPSFPNWPCQADVEYVRRLVYGQCVRNRTNLLHIILMRKVPMCAMPSKAIWTDVYRPLVNMCVLNTAELVVDLLSSWTGDPSAHDVVTAEMAAMISDRNMRAMFTDHVTRQATHASMRQDRERVSMREIADTVTDDASKQCHTCCENELRVVHQPCGHIMMCIACFKRSDMSKCIKCNASTTGFVTCYL